MTDPFPTYPRTFGGGSWRAGERLSAFQISVFFIGSGYTAGSSTTVNQFGPDPTDHRGRPDPTPQRPTLGGDPTYPDTPRHTTTTPTRDGAPQGTSNAGLFWPTRGRRVTYPPTPFRE